MTGPTMRCLALFGAAVLCASAAAPATASPAAGARALYSQMGTDSLSAVSSMVFGKVYAAENDEAADDFVVPAGQTWDITSISAAGQFFTCLAPCGRARRELVTFYAGEAKPGNKVVAVATSVKGSNGSFVLPLGDVTLAAGHYWVSVRVRDNYQRVGYWGWEVQSEQALNPAQWRNPRGGYGLGCTVWSSLAGCTGVSGTDMMFSLAGTKTRPG